MYITNSQPPSARCVRYTDRPWYESVSSLSAGYESHISLSFKSDNFLLEAKKRRSSTDLSSRQPLPNDVCYGLWPDRYLTSMKARRVFDALVCGAFGIGNIRVVPNRVVLGYWRSLENELIQFYAGKVKRHTLCPMFRASNSKSYVYPCESKCINVGERVGVKARDIPPGTIISITVVVGEGVIHSWCYEHHD